MGEFSEGVDTWRDKPVSRPAVGYLPYGERKPCVLADTLTALIGPTSGVVTLPRHLDWSGHAEYSPRRATRQLRRVEATTWLNERLSTSAEVPCEFPVAGS